MKMAANDIQHGGDHYVAPYQHWDMVVDFRLDYYRANATKYLTRHRKKNGLQDVDKADHYVQKLIELIEHRRFNQLVSLPTVIETAMHRMAIRYFEANGISERLDQSSLASLMITPDVNELIAARTDIDKIRGWYASQPKTGPEIVLPAKTEASLPVALVSGTGGVYRPSAQFTREGYRGDKDCWQCRKCFEHFEVSMDTNPEVKHVCGGGQATSAYVDQAGEGSK